MFARRIIPAVLAFAVAFAPAAMQACQATCAMHTSTTGGDAHHSPHAAASVDASSASEHSGHHHPASVAAADASVLTGGPHACDHADELPVTAGAIAPIALEVPAVLAVAWEFRAPPLTRAHRFVVVASGRDSIPIAVILPIRV
jgi:hypothetical protein